MMFEHILILVLLTPPAGGPSVTTATFADRDSCMFALRMARSELHQSFNGICVPKSKDRVR